MGNVENLGRRPDPVVRIDSAFFWEACERGEFVAQKCCGCDRLWHPPRGMCPVCHSTQKTTAPLSGRGRVMSFAMPVHPPAYGFDEPPIPALIELEEGLRFVGTLVAVEPDDVVIGMPVKVGFAATTGGKAVPVFHPAGEHA
ncbi:OB-fold domain-containing protein [Croceicoccus sp. F390]|uniref:OB-fold domain-containing protein n=1 Tax=Croceicoccus esteveae TaxID=3075597 RepID=A0ABU2ZF25_9SPHN|nr:OB-fold domain-containing protein [Croceicoccus sp. F390]MDT0575200.1 OB-fold domain-containing protein [Croceicoccus sp. F390]